VGVTNYYKFGSKFDTIEFAVEINVNSGSDTLDKTRATSCPKTPPPEVVNSYRVSQYEVQPSEVWTFHL
jgi:hypothetical protein